MGRCLPLSSKPSMFARSAVSDSTCPCVLISWILIARTLIVMGLQKEIMSSVVQTLIETVPGYRCQVSPHCVQALNNNNPAAKYLVQQVQALQQAHLEQFVATVADDKIHVKLAKRCGCPCSQDGSPQDARAQTILRWFSGCAHWRTG